MELKLCPFCGGRASVFHWKQGEGQGCAVRCTADYCGGETATAMSGPLTDRETLAKMAAEYWNRRVPDSATDE